MDEEQRRKRERSASNADNISLASGAAQQLPQQQIPRRPTQDVSSLPSARTLQIMLPRMPPDYQIIMSPMFADLSRIDEHLFLTGIGGMTKENVSNNNITCIVNATFEAPNLKQQGIEAIRIAVDDAPTDDISRYFDLAADKIYEHAKRGGRTIVHCVAGVSRSSALTIAYLIKYKRMSLHDAFNHVKARRQVIRPNNGFFRQLIEYEKRCLGKASVKMIKVTKENITIEIPDFFETEYPRNVVIEALKEKAKLARDRRV